MSRCSFQAKRTEKLNWKVRKFKTFIRTWILSLGVKLQDVRKLDKELTKEEKSGNTIEQI